MKRNIPLLSILLLLYSCLEFVMFFQYITRISIDLYSLKFLTIGVLFLLTALYWIFYELYLLILYNLFLLIIFSILFCKIDRNKLYFDIIALLVIDTVMIINKMKKKLKK